MAPLTPNNFTWRNPTDHSKSTLILIKTLHDQFLSAPLLLAALSPATVGTDQMLYLFSSSPAPPVHRRWKKRRRSAWGTLTLISALRESRRGQWGMRWRACSLFGRGVPCWRGWTKILLIDCEDFKIGVGVGARWKNIYFMRRACRRSSRGPVGVMVRDDIEDKEGSSGDGVVVS